MISNMQQQEFDMLNKILKTDNAGIYVNNNNNNNTNKNIHMMPSSIVHNQNSNDMIIYDPSIDYFDQSSLNAKEIVTVASQQSFENTPTILTINNLNMDHVIIDGDEVHLQKKRESNIDQRQECAFVNNAKKYHSYVNGMESQQQKQRDSINNENNTKTTINNQQDHNDTLRCIKDVHNYSKINRFDDSTNSSSPEEDDDDDGCYDDDDDDVFKANNNNTSTKAPQYDCNGHNKKLLQLKRNGSIDEILIDKSPRKSSSIALTPTSLDVPDDDENGEKVTPDHHARRPMNAFLIFCKRHRAIVREKYKHLENRSITKILGEWWAMLDTKDKAFYTELAKQYKDAFFSANPNFKWYKLPAPPLRTLATRPGNTERPLTAANHFYPYTNDYETFTGIKDNIHRTTGVGSPIAMMFDQMENRRNNNFQKSTNVGEFKLADEAQMGSLSSLMCTMSGSPNSNGNFPSDNINTNNDNNRENRLDHEALQNVLSETSSFISSTMPSLYKDGEPFQNMRDHATKMENDFVINGKRKSTDIIISSRMMDGYKKFCSRDNNFSPTNTTEIDPVPKKSSRSCKGKKYQEFMNSGQITPFVKKVTTSKSCRSTSTTFPHNGYCKNPDSLPDSCGDHHHQQQQQHHYLMQPIKIENPIPDRFSINSNNHYHQQQPQQQQQQPLDSPTSIKQFDASDFDLEKKIKALPAQSLDDYLLRKHETKKKKKIGSKRRTPSTTSFTSTAKQQYQRPPQTIQEARERIQNTMVGSQKRKARKESITRRDINAMSSSEQQSTVQSSSNLFDTFETLVQLGATVKTELDIDDDEVILQQPATTNATSDLLILAEVAANHIIDKVEI